MVLDKIQLQCGSKKQGIPDSITDSSLAQRNNGVQIQLQIQYQVQYQIRFQIQYCCFAGIQENNRNIPDWIFLIKYHIQVIINL